MKQINNYYRKLFFDYHMRKSVTNVGRGFNAAEFADTLKESNVEVMSAFVRCGGGYRYYRKGKYGTIHPSLPEGCDLVEETITECHKRDIKVIGYCAAWHSEPHAEANDGMKHRANGDYVAIEICGNSPVFENELLPQFTEIAANYDLDAMFFDCVFSEAGRTCYCKYCQEKFARDTGAKSIPLTVDDPYYETYIKWHNNCYKDFRKRIIAAVHTAKPDMPVSINWQNVVRSPEKAGEDVAFLSQDSRPENILACEQTQAKFWALSGKPFSLMNNLSLQWWSSYDIKPVNTLIQEAMVPIINGGRPWVGFQMYQDYSTAPFAMKTVKNVFEYIKNIESVFDTKEIVPYIGVLNGENQLNTSRSGEDFSTQVDTVSLCGINKILTTSGIPYNSGTEQDLTDKLNKFKAVIITNNQYISPEFYKQLKEYVSGGGNLIITGKSGCVDIDGRLTKNADFEALTGISIERGSGYPYSYIKADKTLLNDDEADMPILCADEFFYVKPITVQRHGVIVNSYYKRENGKINWGGIPSFAAPYDETDRAAITFNKYGKGKVVYLAADFFKGYIGINNWRLKRLIKNIINNCLLNDSAIITDAPAVIEMTLMRDTQTCNLLVNFLNTMREMPVSEIKERREIDICEDILPVYNITVKLPLEQRPQKIQTVLSKENIPFEYENHILKFTVPKVEIYEGAEIIF